MNADVIPLVVGFLIFFSSLLSLRFGLSVAIIEILLGAMCVAIFVLFLYYLVGPEAFGRDAL